MRLGLRAILRSCFAAPRRLVAPLQAHLSAFAGDRRGNVALIFALSLVPLVVAAGAGVDYSRALIVRSQLSEALDAAGLAVGAANTLSDDQIKTLAQSYFDANFKLDPSYGTPEPISVDRGNGQVVLSTSVDMPTTLMSVVGYKDMPVSFSSTIVWGHTRLWVSLVLDNTGSMCEPDYQPCQYDTNPNTKINTLKTASHNLLQQLQNAAGNPGDVKVSIVPFTKDVNVGSNNYTASWIDWTSWNSANTTTQQVCGWHTYNFFGFTYQRWECGNQQVTADHNTWNGCITDRDQDYDEKNTTPTTANTHTLFPAEQYSACPVALMGLSDDWDALSKKIDTMVANGTTNQTIGFVWGWQTLTDGDPFNTGPLPDETQRIIILLSDGQNTQSRYSSNQSSIDTREKAACDNAKAAGVLIYTVYVHPDSSGNSGPLLYCASDSSKYFDLTQASQIITAFQTIGTQITNLRVAK